MRIKQCVYIKCLGIRGLWGRKFAEIYCMSFESVELCLLRCLYDIRICWRELLESLQNSSTVWGSHQFNSIALVTTRLGGIERIWMPVWNKSDCRIQGLDVPRCNLCIVWNKGNSFFQFYSAQSSLAFTDIVTVIGRCSPMFVVLMGTVCSARSLYII